MGRHHRPARHSPTVVALLLAVAAFLSLAADQSPSVELASPAHAASAPAPAVAVAPVVVHQHPTPTVAARSVAHKPVAHPVMRTVHRHVVRHDRHRHHHRPRSHHHHDRHRRCS